MRQRLIFGVAGLVVLLGFAVVSLGGGDDPAPEGADRAVEPDWDAQSAILRSQIIEEALDDGMSRTMASCMIAAIEGTIALDRIADFDLGARTGSGASAAEADLLADALLGCGPSVGSLLGEAAPGSGSIPNSHATEAECLREEYGAGVRAAYTARFRSSNERGAHDVDVLGPIRKCDAAGAMILGASDEGLFEASSLSTLEWKCMVERLPASAFERAFPFPDEPGDALARLGSAVEGDVAFCEAWVAGTPITG